jgi:hypothetical protein
MNVLECIRIGFATMMLAPSIGAATLNCSLDPNVQRAELVGLALRYDTLSVQLGDLGYEGAEALHANAVEMLAKLAQLEPEPANKLCQLLNENANLLAIPAQLDQIVTVARTNHLQAASNCLSLPDSAWNAIYVNTQALQATATFASGLCGATECVSFICVGTCAIAGIAQSAALVGQAVLDRADYCGSIETAQTTEKFSKDSKTALDLSVANLDIIVPRTDLALSTRATQLQVLATSLRSDRGFDKLANLINDLKVTTVSQTTVNQTSGDSARKQLIETALLSLAPNGLISLQLPASKGGLLEQVREQIASTIQIYRGLGVDVSAALVLFGAGDAALNARNYKLAYAKYRDAYRTITTTATSKPVDKP